MIAVCLALLCADPLALRDELRSADIIEVYYHRTQERLTIDPGDAELLSLLLNCKDEIVSRDLRSGFDTTDVFELRMYKADRRSAFTIIGDQSVVSNNVTVALSDDRFSGQLRALFLKLELPTPSDFIIQQRLIHPNGLSQAVIAGDERFLLGVASKTLDLEVFNLDPRGARLTHARSFSDASRRKPDSLATSPSCVYIGDGAIKGFRQRAKGGTRFELIEGKLGDGSVINVSPDGKHLYSAHEADLIVYKTREDGGLEVVQRIPNETLGRVSDIAVLDEYFATITHSGSLGWFSRDSVTGRIELVSIESDRVEGGLFRPADRGLVMASSIALTGDRMFIASLSGRVSVWRWEGGKPVFQEVFVDDKQGVRGLAYATDIVATKSKVWVVAGRDEALTWFDLEDDTVRWGGSLEIGQARHLAVSPNEEFVYAIGDEWIKVVGKVRQ